MDAKSQSITLRPFRKEDLASAYALDQICFPEGIAYSRAELRYFVSRPNAYAIVAEKAGDFAGFVVATHNPRQVAGLAHIVTLDVEPNLRRAGIASMLMERAERHYREIGRTGLALEVAVDNESAQQFYRQRGFMPTGLIRGYYNGVLDAVAMRKEFP